MTYQPKGSMCSRCQHVNRDCSGLKFEHMPVIEKAGDVLVVKCDEWEKRK